LLYLRCDELSGEIRDSSGNNHKPLPDSVYSLRPNEGKFGGAVAIEEGKLVYEIPMGDEWTYAEYIKVLNGGV
jgi:hypothetical protein